MKLYSYVLDHDYGFAPNPFFGVCTLATCKPKIRDHAVVGDYIVGTGCAKRDRRGFLVYFMRVEEIITFDAYWADPRFERKRPFLHGSKMRSFGDNIYHRNPATGNWCQANSFHSLPEGSYNPLNIEHDTHSEKVLIGSDFTYWGGSGPEIPYRFRNYSGGDICGERFYRVNFPDGLVPAFVAWMRSLNEHGFIGRPLDWPLSG